MPYSAPSVEFLKTLIGFRSITRESNLDLIEWVRALLERHGISTRLVLDESGSKANLHACVGPADRPGIMLSGHTDVVPVAGQDWSTDPFVGIERNGSIYGRGACDMKGFIACALSAMIDAARRPLQKPLHLALSYDEEIGCIGVRRLLDILAAVAVQPSVCIIGEPTLMRIGLGHKGKMALRAVCCGSAGHSALAPKHLNAIHLATELVQGVQDVQRRLVQAGAQDEAYDIPYTTLHVGRINGGTAVNIVPDHCAIDFEIRHLKEDDPRHLLGLVEERAGEIVAAARKAYGEGGIEIREINSYPGLNTHPAAQAVHFVEQMLGGHAEKIKVAFGTEGGLFEERLGVPVVVCGPGSIEQAHKANEYVALAQLQACDALMLRLVAAVGA
jgi:acetylornithine deacetylase